MNIYRIFENKYTGRCRIKHDEGWVMYTDLAGLAVEDDALASHVIREWHDRIDADAWVREMEMSQGVDDDAWEEVV